MLNNHPDRMQSWKKLFIVCVTLATSALFFACSKQGEQFVGTWSNEWKGGSMRILVTHDDRTHFLVKVVLTNGAIFQTGQGEMNGDHLVVNNGTGMFDKLAFSSSENALLLVNKPDSPMYKKMQAP